MNFTLAQEQAVSARGNVLVVAGAGTGKTRTLVERCLHCLVEEAPRASLDEMLMVTFTEAAAAEMRQRIRARLEEQLARKPGDPHWQQQLALFDTAHIGTLHSFCLKLVRQHFYELELDPQLKVLAEEEARLLAEETLDAILQAHYAGAAPQNEAVRQLIRIQGDGWDKPIRTLVLKLHNYTQSLPDPERWLTEQRNEFDRPQPATWLGWLLGGLDEWRTQWLNVLTAESSAGNRLAANCVQLLSELEERTERSASAALLQRITEAGQACPRGKRGEWGKPLEVFLQEAGFLVSLLATNEGNDPLLEDWSWVRAQMRSLLELTWEFGAAFEQAKRETGALDFQDLEQHTLRLLWDKQTGQATPLAREWRSKLRFVFVDEYQDINAAQDRIIQGLSREGPEANRFLVGDVKQSIYRFRLANPRIFQGYLSKWTGQAGQSLTLSDNFRSREGIIEFVNSFFSAIMARRLGGVDYQQEGQLRFGAAGERHALRATTPGSACVELHLRVKSSEKDDGEAELSEAMTEIAGLRETEKEARLIAKRLCGLRLKGHQVWDETNSAFRAVEWRDMAILLRSPANKAESFAKEFSRLNIPLQVERGGFYRSAEVLDLLSLLQMLDNPLQDVPALALLRSPLVGLTLNELAAIRLVDRKVRFWVALRLWEQANSKAASATHHKVALLLERFARWRRLARQLSLSRCLETVLAETHYEDWLLSQPNGDQRKSRVERLLALAARFDQFKRQGLFRFLRFIEAQQLAETDPEAGPTAQQNAVRLMSIHQSKGLEFPVVVVADLNKQFNLADLRAEIILDEEYGLCPRIKLPHTGQRYPSLPYWLARRRQKHELLGEELRLLYVAMTRARDLLLLSGNITEKQLEEYWLSPRQLRPEILLSATRYSDWLSVWFSQNSSAIGPEQRSGEMAGVKWTVHGESDLVETEAQPLQMEQIPGHREEDFAILRKLEERLAWRYPAEAATLQPAKTSASALSRRAGLLDEEAVFFPNGPRVPTGRRERVFKHGSKRMTAAEIGTAHHAFLQEVSLERTGTVEELRKEAQRLQAAGVLTPEQAGALDFRRLAAFWDSSLGKRVRAQSQFVARELAFTARFTLSELVAITAAPAEPALAGEFVVVQGVADLVVLLPSELWLVDFKTDQLQETNWAEKVKEHEPQLRLYAQALARIYSRPVTEAWLYFLELSKPAAVSGLSATMATDNV